MRRPWVLGLLSCLALAPALPVAAAGPAVPAAPARIAVIGRADASPSWQAVKQGALDAARDLGVTVTFSAPSDEPLADAQAQLLDDALAAHPAAVCMDAIDSARILPLLQKARRAHVFLIGFGHGVDSPLALTTAAPDNAAAAALAANKLAALLGGAGAVGLVLRDATAPSSIAQREGFQRLMSRRYPGIRVTASSYSGGDAKTAGDQVTLMLQADAGLSGLFIGDEDSVAGVVTALREAAAGRKLAVVGFGSGAAQVEAVRSGVLAGAVTRDPVRMGYGAVAAAVDALNGRRVPPFIDTGFHWYDRTNIDDPSIAVILHP